MPKWSRVNFGMQVVRNQDEVTFFKLWEISNDISETVYTTDT